MKKAKVKSKKVNVGAGVFACLWLLAMNFPAQTGGQFAITQSVMANGGAVSNGGDFSLTGTSAQSVAGVNSTSEQFAVNGGFWQPFFAPTAANASVSGRVTTASGNGISGVRVVITNQTGQSQIVLSNPFGYFNFSAVLTGEIYFITVQSKRYGFSNGTQVLFVDSDLKDLVFIADWEN